MKLSELKEIIDKSIRYAEGCDPDSEPDVEVYFGETEYRIKRISQLAMGLTVMIEIEYD